MMRRTTICLVIASALAVAGCTVTAKGYVTKGNKLYAARNYAEADLNYRKAVQKDPRSGEAYYRLGLAAIKLDQSKEAYIALARAVELLPNLTDAKEKYASLSLSLYMVDLSRPKVLYDRITRLSDELLAQDANNFEGLRLKGYLAFTDRKPEEAIAFFRKATQVKPGDPVLTTVLVQILIQSGRLPEAEKVALDLISRKSPGPIYGVLYGWYYDSNRITDAENILKKQISIAPQQAAPILELAKHYARVRKYEEMRNTIQGILDHPQDFPQARMQVGDYYLSLRNYQEALRYYEEGARTDFKNKVTYQKRIVDSLIALGRKDDAAQVVEEVLKQEPKDDEALQVHATLWLDTGRPEKVQGAAREFQTLLTRHPEDSSLWFKAGRAAMLTDDLETARTRFLEALRRRGDLVAARYELAEISLKQKKPNETIQFASEILLRDPKDVRGRLLRAQGLIAANSLSLARAELADLIKDSPQSTEARMYWGLIAIEEKRYQQAIDTFGKLHGFDDPRVAVGLSSAYYAQGQPDKAFQTLNEALKKSPDSPAIHGQLARIAALSGQYDLAIAEFRKTISADPKSLEDRLRLGEAYELKGDYEGAIAAYKEAEGLSPKDPVLIMSLASALAKAGHTNEARAHYQRVIDSYPNYPFALNSLAYLLSETGGDLDEALKLAQRAIETTPGQPSFMDTMGCIYLKKGMRVSAIQTFGNLVRKYPKYPTFRYHLAMALFENGDKAGARKELETALANHPSREVEVQIKKLVSKTQT
jgi:tetratricopeptide (TPR) repeat protein